MKRIILSITLLTIFQILGHAQNQPKVAILGTYHMSNPGLDAANFEADDVKTPQRQKELDELADMLVEFRPTKIAIEVPFGSEGIQKKYQEYRANPDPMSMAPNEVYQLAFRVAEKLDHKDVYPIDYNLELNPPSMDSLMASDPSKAQYLQGYIAVIQDSIKNWTENILYKKSIAEFLAFMNSEEAIEMNYSIYLDFLKELYAENNYAGAEMLSLWHERNLKIFQHLTQITDWDNSEERILILYGQGHSKILKDLVQDATYYEFVDVLDLISKN